MNANVDAIRKKRYINLVLTLENYENNSHKILSYKFAEAKDRLWYYTDYRISVGRISYIIQQIVHREVNDWFDETGFHAYLRRTEKHVWLHFDDEVECSLFKLAFKIDD